MTPREPKTAPLHRPADSTKSGLHPRNRNNTRYDLASLLRDFPELAPYRFRTPTGEVSIDFSDPEAVRSLNTVLLKAYYGITEWSLPPEYLCPPIPGRADYLHHLADLLATDRSGAVPSGASVHIFEIGTGASSIYPLLGRAEYGWRFTATEADHDAYRSALRNRDGNGISAEEFTIRYQPDGNRFFHGMVEATERFDAVICNPPFHSTIEQAMAGTRRKWKNLGLPASRRSTLNFGGRGHELVYPGGEVAFITGMIRESSSFSRQVIWFTTLVSKASNLPALRAVLSTLPVREVRELEMAQGQKRSRLLVWTYFTPEERYARSAADRGSGGNK